MRSLRLLTFVPWRLAPSCLRSYLTSLVSVKVFVKETINQGFPYPESITVSRAGNFTDVSLPRKVFPCSSWQIQFLRIHFADFALMHCLVKLKTDMLKSATSESYWYSIRLTVIPTKVVWTPTLCWIVFPAKLICVALLISRLWNNLKPQCPHHMVPS